MAKAPASTVQILGAEKALFRALKTKGNTPKYGLIYHSTFIGRANAKNKGRISRYLANKCSIATRIDSFSDEPSRLYGEKLRDQVEERLKFYETGAAPRKNIDVMQEVARELKAAEDVEMDDADEEEEAVETPKPKKDKKKKKKRKSDVSAADEEEEEEAKTPSEEKKKKKKRKAADDDDDDDDGDDAEEAPETPKPAKKAKKSSDSEATPKSEKKSAKKSDKKKKKKKKSLG